MEICISYVYGKGITWVRPECYKIRLLQRRALVLKVYRHISSFAEYFVNVFKVCEGRDRHRRPRLSFDVRQCIKVRERDRDSETVVVPEKSRVALKNHIVRHSLARM